MDQIEDKVYFNEIPIEDGVPVEFSIALYLAISVQELASRIDDAVCNIDEEGFNKIFNYVYENVGLMGSDENEVRTYVPPVKLSCEDFNISIRLDKVSNYFEIVLKKKQDILSR